jgi:Rps23 Pro-64 3,4-dihydroxylase Tpa1-like proline 4-hydroxylase
MNSDKCPKCGAEFWEIGSSGETWYRCSSWSHVDSRLHFAESERCLRNQLAQAQAQAQAEIERLRAEWYKERADLRRLSELWHEWGVLSGRGASEILSKYRTNGESEGE